MTESKTVQFSVTSTIPVMTLNRIKFDSSKLQTKFYRLGPAIKRKSYCFIKAETLLLSAQFMLCASVKSNNDITFLFTQFLIPQRVVFSQFQSQRVAPSPEKHKLYSAEGVKPVEFLLPTTVFAKS